MHAHILYMHACMCMQTYTYMHAFIHTVHAYIDTCMQIHMYTCMYTYRQTYQYIHCIVYIVFVHIY